MLYSLLTFPPRRFENAKSVFTGGPHIIALSKPTPGD
jgi:hypothetical protein